MNLVFISIFLIEIIIRIIDKGTPFFKNYWNSLYFAIVILSWAGMVIVQSTEFSDNRWVKSLVNCIQIIRIARVFKSFKFFKKVFSTLVSIIPETGNIAFLLCLFLISYGVIGVEMFAFLKPQKNVGGDFINFRNIFNSLYILLRSVTNEQWFLLMNDCARTVMPSFVCQEINNYEQYEKNGS